MEPPAIFARRISFEDAVMQLGIAREVRIEVARAGEPTAIATCLVVHEGVEDTGVSNANAEIQRQTQLFVRLANSEDDEEKEKLLEEIDEIDIYIMSLSAPLEFEGENDAIENLEQGFERLCFLLEQNGIKEPEWLPVRKFYSKVKFLQEQHRQQSQ